MFRHTGGLSHLCYFPLAVWQSVALKVRHTGGLSQYTPEWCILMQTVSIHSSLPCAYTSDRQHPFVAALCIYLRPSASIRRCLVLTQQQSPFMCTCPSIHIRLRKPIHRAHVPIAGSSYVLTDASAHACIQMIKLEWSILQTCLFRWSNPRTAGAVRTKIRTDA